MTIFNQGSLITAAGVQQLEQNFAGGSAPSGPVTGQLWYDTGTSTLKVYNGSTWSEITSGSSGIASGRQLFTSNGTFTIPTGVTEIKVTVIGGGGGGGGTSTNGSQAGAGGSGAGGGVAVKYYSGLTPGNTVLVTVGAGGTAGSGSGNGGTGGVSTVVSGTQLITTLSATGGEGGTAPSSPGGSGTSSVFPGSGAGGDYNYNGGIGNSPSSDFDQAWSAAGGGSLAHASESNNAAAYTRGGPGYLGGNGGTGTYKAYATGAQPGWDGTGYGNGGSGGASARLAGATPGGAGSSGAVLFEW